MSRRSLSDEHQAEMNRLRAVSAFIWEFMAQRDSLVRDLAAQAASALQAACERHDLRAVRLAVRDNIEWIESLPQIDQKELRRLLKERLGFEVERDRQDLLRGLRQAIARGRLRDDDEFRLARGYLDGTGEDLTAQERAALMALLGDYES